MRDPMLAGILSFIVPGVGQLYNGRILAGVHWLILTPGFWIGSGGTLGLDLSHHCGLHRVLLRDGTSSQGVASGTDFSLWVLALTRLYDKHKLPQIFAYRHGSEPKKALLSNALFFS